MVGTVIRIGFVLGLAVLALFGKAPDKSREAAKRRRSIQVVLPYIDSYVRFLARQRILNEYELDRTRDAVAEAVDTLGLQGGDAIRRGPEFDLCMFKTGDVILTCDNVDIYAWNVSMLEEA